VTRGGIHLAKQTVDKERLATVVGYVVRLGPDAYKDDRKFPEGPWCQEGDWIIFGRYAGARIQIEGGDLRLLNDDEILAVINDPEDILAG
jgi:co-chaperonin GroES (HSP10)